MQSRDLFAMNAMKALVSNMETSNGTSADVIDDITSLSYEIADAMEIKRKQKYPSRYKGKAYERGDGNEPESEEPNDS